MSQQMTALIIEDNEELNALFTEAMQESGFVTVSVLDGEEAELRLAEIVPQLILLDLHLPYISGADLLLAIRQDPRLTDAIVVVASADGTWSGIVGEQADFVLNKPVSYMQLRDISSRIYQNLLDND
jgi:CheY-like chemotaxis protein